MSRDDFDIPEVFRKAMEDAGWDTNRKEGGGDGGDDGGDDGGREEFPRRPDSPRQRNRTIWLLGLFFLLLLSLNWIVTTYTEWLWFQELAYERVWLKQWGAQVVSFLVFFIIGGGILLLNWHLARRRARKHTPEYYPQFLDFPGFKWIINGVGAFFAFIFASAGASRWEDFLLYFNRVPYGASDPIFGQDVSFYLFELPIFEFLQGWFLSLLLLTGLGTILLYALNYLPEIQRGRFRLQESAVFRQHVAILGALFLGSWTVGYGLDIFGLLYSGRGVVFGASYTDMNASLYALWAQLILLGITAVLVAVNAVRQMVRPVLVAGGLWIAASFLLGGVYPGLLQRYAVEPNEIVRESPYIEHNINFTRMAFGLDEIESRPFTLGDELTPATLEENNATLLNVRLWDYRPLLSTYEQLQALRPYYQFNDIDIDRYDIDGQTRQVMLSGRELNKENLPNPTWVNRNLEFTHGYGIVMNPVDRVTPDGQPEFYIQDLPPTTTVPLQIERPEIYYGELTREPVFVSSGREEFSYPSGDENVYSSYEGEGGVLLNNFLQRLAFALRLADTNVLLSDEINDGTRIQYHREITERVRQVTPFLALDDDPYIVLHNGRLVWVLDAYTTSRSFPYSTPIQGLNYIRNAAKITVDAYDGDVNYYIAAPDDPLIQAYDKIFPGLFKPLSDLPEGLQEHLRYPEDLFTIQTEQFLTYHMTDVRVFYNKEDLWQLPTEIFDGNQQRLEPYYVTLPLPNEEETEFLLIQPFTPANKPNMIAWIAARNDPPNYGQLRAYVLPKQELVFGPIQVEGRIDQDPTISQQLSLWDQRGSRVIRGNLIVVPVADRFLYVEPIYLLSDTSALPELKRVIVASDQRIAMRETLDEALTALLTDAPTVAELEADPDVDVADEATDEEEGPDLVPTAVPDPETPSIAIDASMEELIQAANSHFEAAEAAQRNGDWGAYGRELDALQENLQRLMEMTEQEGADTSP